MENQKLRVYEAIAEVTKRLAVEGIAKERRNQQQGYAFRSIDDLYNHLAPILGEVGLCILPRVTERSVTERESAKGGALFSVVLRVEYDVVAASDGSKHTVVVYGEAMDSGDKATNKAMSAAYKYACLQMFSIPTEGDNDADASTPPPSKPVERPWPNKPEMVKAFNSLEASAQPEQKARLAQLKHQFGIASWADLTTREKAAEAWRLAKEIVP